MKQVLLFTALLILFSCSNGTKNGTSLKTKPLIVTTTGMIADAVKNLVGDSADVIALMGPGVDPHLYKATQGDLERLNTADIIVYNGLHLEGKMSEILEKIASKKIIIAIANQIPANKFRLLDEKNHIYDPHIWFDVTLWKEGVIGLSKELKKKCPALTTAINTKSQTYLDKLDSLQIYVSYEMATIPKTQRVLITAHDAFGYFGRAYDTEVRGLQGISTVSDFGLNDVTQLVNLITERKIKAVFVETSVSDQSIKAVIDGCTQKGHPVKIGGTLFSDAMGTAGTPEGTYIGMVKKNVETIVQALK